MWLGERGEKNRKENCEGWEWSVACGSGLSFEYKMSQVSYSCLWKKIVWGLKGISDK